MRCKDGEPVFTRLVVWMSVEDECEWSIFGEQVGQLISREDAQPAYARRTRYIRPAGYVKYVRYAHGRVFKYSTQNTVDFTGMETFDVFHNHCDD